MGFKKGSLVYTVSSCQRKIRYQMPDAAVIDTFYTAAYRTRTLQTHRTPFDVPKLPLRLLERLWIRL